MAAKTSKTMIAVLAVATVVGAVVGIFAASSGGGLGIAAMVGGFVAVGVAITVALKHNRKVPEASEAERARALAPPEPGMGRLLIVREGFVGKLAGVDVTVDGRWVTQLKSPRYAVTDVPPGTHELVATIQKKSAPPLTLAVAAGEVAVARITMALGAVSIDRDQDGPALRDRLRTMTMVSSQ